MISLREAEFEENIAKKPKDKNKARTIENFYNLLGLQHSTVCLSLITSLLGEDRIEGELLDIRHNMNNDACVIMRTEGNKQKWIQLHNIKEVTKI